MFKARPLSIGVAFGVLGLAGCALQVRTDVNPRQSVAACHSYAWAPEIPNSGAAPPRQDANPLNAERLRAAIDSNLQSKGLRPADTAGADCLVGFEVEKQAARVGLFDWLFAMNRRFALPRLAMMTAAVIIAASGFMLGGGLGESMAQDRYANAQSNELTEFLVSDGI